MESKAKREHQEHLENRETLNTFLMNFEKVYGFKKDVIILCKQHVRKLGFIHTERYQDYHLAEGDPCFYCQEEAHMSTKEDHKEIERLPDESRPRS
jgi:hypothetical protein